MPVSMSSAVLPELREYERTITTVANAVGAAAGQAATSPTSRASCGTRGVSGSLSILRSDGGLVSAGVAADNPVNLLLSGPAGGVTGAAWVAAQAGYRNFLTFDMGGTSTDVALVQDLHAAHRPRDHGRRPQGPRDVGRRPHRRRRRRLHRARPAAHPGAAGRPAVRRRRRPARRRTPPAATEPTVTDANVVLGHLPTALAGGEVTPGPPRRPARPCRPSRTRRAWTRVEAAAAGIIDIVNENMFGALRLVSVQQGFDPRDFALVAFGGAGPLHANALGRLTGSWPVIIPPSPACSAPTATRPPACVTRRSARCVRRFAALTDDEPARRSWTSWRRRHGAR